MVFDFQFTCESQIHKYKKQLRIAEINKDGSYHRIKKYANRKSRDNDRQYAPYEKVCRDASCLSLSLLFLFVYF